MMNLRDAVRTQFNSDMLITEYIPYNQTVGNITYVPLNAVGVPMVAFEDVMIYSQEGDMYTTPYTTKYVEEYVMPKEMYELSLQQLILQLEMLNPGKRVTIKGDSDKMYARYKNCISFLPVAGVISIMNQVPTTEMDTVPTVKFFPPEGVKQLLGFDSYCVAAKLLLPMVLWDFTTLYVAYKQYEKSKESENKTPTEFWFWFQIPERTLSCMSAIIDGSGAGAFTKEQITAHLLQQTELNLTTFCQNMLLNYHQNPVGIEKLLMYSSQMLASTYANMKRNAGILRDDTWVIAYDDSIVTDTPKTTRIEFENISLI